MMLLILLLVEENEAISERRRKKKKKNPSSPTLDCSQREARGRGYGLSVIIWRKVAGFKYRRKVGKKQRLVEKECSDISSQD
jgi:hypothetical protein